MATTTTKTAMCLLPHAFHSFLLAPTGENDKGMQVSVLSVLARQDVDPWLEAASLSRLPQNKATELLASFISSALNDETQEPERTLRAAALIALLPHAAQAASGPVKIASGIRPAPNLQSAMFMVFAGLFLVCALTAEFGVASQQGPTSGAGRGMASSYTTPAAPSGLSP